MKIKQSVQEKNKSKRLKPWPLIIGIVVFILMIMTSAELILREYIGENHLEWVILFNHAVMSFMIAKMSLFYSPKQGKLALLLNGIIYLGALLGINILFYGGQFSAVGQSLLAILFGAVMAIITQSIKTHKRGRRH